MIVLKIDVLKIPKERIFVGKKGKYLDIRLVENKDGEDQYGNHGFVAVDLPKSLRDAGDKGEIVGNWKHVGQKPAPRARKAPPKGHDATRDTDLDAPEEDDIPF